MGAAPGAESASAKLNPKVSEFVKSPKLLLIGGKWVPAKSGKTFETINPATEEVLANVAEADQADVDEAVKAARRTFEESKWPVMRPADRARFLFKIAELIEANAAELAQLETLDNGKAINESKNIDIPMAAENILKEADWLVPRYANEAGRIRISFHSLIVESEGLRILIDTCVGDDKQRNFPRWNLRHSSYLSELAKAGFPRESIDRVICTHLHIDHVGWNAMLENGRWVPTFPNARYLLSRREWDHWSQSKDEETQRIMDDSVRPVIDAGLVDWVEGGHTVTSEVATESTPGHSPGHMAVRIKSRGHEGVVTGDLIHHPIQCGHPEWKPAVDFDADQACQTRRGFLARCADERTLCIGTHFAPPTAGRIEKRGDAFRFEG